LDLFVILFRIAILKAVLMDHTPKKSRGRWNALETLNRATFAGSASLGGYLVGTGATGDLGWELAYVTGASLTGASVLTMGILVWLID
jgi:hypothetical protein